jgi:formylglycine-generating enzyme required for sulfatase activity
LLNEAEWREDPVLSIVAKRQHVDWRSFRHDAVNSPALAQAIERLCTKIVETLRERSLSREERRQFEAEAPKRAEEQERVFQEAEAKKQGDEQDAKRRREEAQTQRRPAQGAERRALESVATWPWRPSRRGAVVAGLLVAMVAAGAAAWWNQHQLKHEVQPQTAVTPPARAAQPQTTTIAPGPAAEKEDAHPPATATAAAPAPQPQATVTGPAPAAEETRPSAAVTAITAAQERALKPGDSFKECSNCPEMIVAPAGHFLMGSGAVEDWDNQRPVHEVTIEKPFAVAKFALTFDEWDACAAHGNCRADVDDNGWGRGRRPVINVSWDDALAYANWLSSVTGKPYRLLSEAEYEYAARAGSQTKYPWGDEIKPNGKVMANCDGCGSRWDNKQTAPVGSLAANAFGLYDMVGNV